MKAAALAATMTMAMLWPEATLAAELQVGLRSEQPVYEPGEPVRLTLAVTNRSGRECGLTDAPFGAVQVISVLRDGVELVPSLGRSFYPDGIGAQIVAGLVPVASGSKLDVAVTSMRMAEATDPDGVVLRSVTPTALGGGLDTMWSIGAPGEYQVTATYGIPPVDAEIVACSGLAAAATVSFTVGAQAADAQAADTQAAAATTAAGLPPWVWWSAGALAVVIVGLVVALLVRRRRGGIASVLLLLGTAVGPGVGVERAQARLEIDPNAGQQVGGVDFAAEVNTCLARFNASGGDPAGIMSRLADSESPLVRIVPIAGGSETIDTMGSQAGKGSSTVTWNPISIDPYLHDVARDPCAALYHELVHAYDISRGQIPQGECANTGIPRSEVRAVLAENEYRQRHNLPPRTRYWGDPMPASMRVCPQDPVVPPKTPLPSGPQPMTFLRRPHFEDGPGTGSSNGDPHLVTFDQTYYDFQAVGEFVLVRSTSGDPLEIQTRQATFGPTRAVSINTAVAFRIGEDTVSLTLIDGVTRVHVDGKPVEPAMGDTRLPGGGQLSVRASDTSPAHGYDLRWPDGSMASIDQIGPYSYRVLVRPSAGRAGAVEGLLGDYDGDPSNDIAPPTGEPLEQPAEFGALYPSFANGWRITPETSRFHYAEGEGTETFTDRSHPERSLTVDDLDGDARAQAEGICRAAGVTDPRLLRECTLDVAATHRPDFAVSAAATELTAPPLGTRTAAFQTAPTDGGAALEPGVDRPGSDFKDFDLERSEPVLCQKACADEPECKAFTYVVPGVQGEKARCWLKNTVPEKLESDCCVSGVK